MCTDRGDEVMRMKDDRTEGNNFCSVGQIIACALNGTTQSIRLIAALILSTS